MEPLGLGELSMRLGAALLLGFVLGVERERKRRPAGMRTIMLVSLGCAGFMAAAWQMMVVLPATGDATSEITRVLQGVIQGIGFLGAGAIIQSRGHVRGMTTAATIWVAAGVGIAAGLGLYVVAAAVTVLALVTLVVFQPLEDAMFGKNGNGEGAEGKQDDK